MYPFWILLFVISILSISPVFAEPIEVEIKIDLEPEIKLAEFKKLKINEYEIDLDNKLIEDNYKEFLKSQKKYVEIKNIRQIKKTDKVLINLSSKDESVPGMFVSS